MGDGLVPVSSALGRDEDSRSSLFPKPRQWIAYGMNHLDLLGRTEVSDQIVRWFASAPGARRPTIRSTRTRAKARPPGNVALNALST